MQLSTQQQLLVEQRLANEKKSTGVAYLLWFFFGMFSGHRFYLGTTGVAAAQVGLFWGGLMLTPLGIGIPMIIAASVWLLIDAFLIGGLVETDANGRRLRIMNEVSLTTRGD